MKCLIAGTGAIGSLLASYLTKNVQIWLLGRSWHLDPLQQKGYLQVKFPDGSEKKVKVESSHIALTPESLNKKFDVIFITVKAYDTREILQDLEKANVSADCYVLFQNGLSNEEIAREEIPSETTLLRGITTNGAYIPTPGKVVHAGKGMTKIGSIQEENSGWGKRIVKLFEENKLPAKYVEDMAQLIWEKSAINAVINPLTALLQVKNNAILEVQALKNLGEAILDEINKIAKAEGIQLEGLKKKVFKVAKKTGNNKSSMLQDILKGKKTEIDFINGALVRKAQAHEIHVPLNDILWLLIKSKEKIMKRHKNTVVNIKGE